jgi:multidrug efflux pump subunit AcrB
MSSQPSFWEKFLRFKPPIFVLAGILVLAGVMGLIKMPRDEYPEFRVRQGIIIGIYPGATSEEVESQVTDKVEHYLFRYKSVRRAKTHSISRENLMVIYVEVSDVEKDPDGFWVKLRHGLNELKAELPSGLLSLTADNDFGNTSALLIAVRSKTRTYRELEDFVRKLEDDVRTVPSVSRVTRYGVQREEIVVSLDNAKLSRYGIKPVTLAAALKPQSLVGYAGELDDGKFIRPLHVPASYRTENDLAEQIVYADPAGNAVRLKDVARVVRQYEEPSSFVRVNGQKALVVSLEMQRGNNIVTFGQQVNRVIRDFERSLPPDITIETISNIPDVVSRSIGDFMKEFGIAVLAVIAVTLILLPLRVALVAAATIPITILSTIGILWAYGLDLQLVSLACLIMVLGLVVDDPIVIIDNYIEKLDGGLPPRKAASGSVTQLFPSVFGATVTIICCFVPLSFFITGVGADFVRSMPPTVSTALTISLAVASILTPMMCLALIQYGLKRGKKGLKNAFLDGLQRRYDRLVEGVFRKKTLVISIGILTFALGVAVLSQMPRQTFPKLERNQFAVEVTLPEGSSLGQTDAVLRDLEVLLLKDPRVRVVASFVGTSSPRFHTVYAPRFPSRDCGQLVVVTGSNKATLEILDEFSRKYAGRYPSAWVRWQQLEMHRYIDPIEIRLSSDNLADLKRTAAKIEAVLRQDPEIVNVTNDYRQPLQAVRLDVQEDEASRLGFPKVVLDYSLMTATKGLPVATIWEGDYPLAVRLKFEGLDKVGPAEISNLYVTSPLLGAAVPIRQLGQLRPAWTEGDIVRRNGVRTLTVGAELDRHAFASEVMRKVKPGLNRIELPPGLRMEYGGEADDAADIMNPMYSSMVVSIALIFLVLMFEFRSLKKSLLIMIIMPLSVFGAALGIWITRYPFSLTAIIGLISLFGIVVRNGIIYVQYADELRRTQGYGVQEAAIAAGKRRMRPIFLTATAAAVGVVPMMLSRSSLWGPMASVLCFGLLAALALSLVILPVAYDVVHRREQKASNEGVSA